MTIQLQKQQLIRKMVKINKPLNFKKNKKIIIKYFSKINDTFILNYIFFKEFQLSHQTFLRKR
jgi:hypothetical protein